MCLTVLERSSIIYLMNKLSNTRRAKIVRALVEGNSIRATCRMTDTAKGTVLRLLVDLGRVCSEYQDKALRNLPCKRLQLDEIWSFVGVKEKNRPEAERGSYGRGDVWTWAAICADTKVVPSWLVSSRDAGAATEFCMDLAGRLSGRVQITSDGHKAYLSAVEDAFGTDVDYAVLQKLYGVVPEETRYSPAKCIGCRRDAITGSPDPRHVSTSYVERQNLNMRMSMRRFTRLTNAFSRKIENLEAAVALHFMHYNFGRVHQTLRVTPAMEAGVSDHVWTAEEIAALA